MAWSLGGRRNARTNVDRVASGSGSGSGCVFVSGIVTGIEGKYLKLGKRNPDAVDDDDDDDDVASEELDTRMLLNGCTQHHLC